MAATLGLNEQLPVKVGRYVLHRRIGVGGMGIIYLATMEGAAGFKKWVAVKRILPHLINSSAAFVADLVVEAKLMVMLNHPNIVNVFDLAQEGDNYFLAMEYVPGCSLLQILRTCDDTRALVPVGAALGIAVQICRALHYAHTLETPNGNSFGIVHCDISPPNVLVSTAGLVKVIDFGIAKAASRLSITEPGHVRGKYPYMAPEQLSGGAVDARTDIFATGIVLFECLTNRRMFSLDAASKPVGDRLSGHVPSPAEFRPDVSPSLGDAVIKALAVNPADRYQSAAEFEEALCHCESPMHGADLARAVLSGFDSDATPMDLEVPVHLTPHGGASAVDAQFPTVDLLRLGATQAPGARPKWAALNRRGFAAGLALFVAAAVAGTLAYTGRTKTANPGPSAPPVEERPAASAAPSNSAPTKRKPSTKPKLSQTAPHAAGVEPAAGANNKPAEVSPPARAEPAASSTMTPLAADEVLVEVRKRLPEFQACLLRHPEATEAGADKLVVRMRVVSSGAVTQSVLEPQALQGTALAQCLDAVARSIRLRPHPDEYVEFEFPFAIKRQKPVLRAQEPATPEPAAAQ